jgi:hypothetical protein
VCDEIRYSRVAFSYRVVDVLFSNGTGTDHGKSGLSVYRERERHIGPVGVRESSAMVKRPETPAAAAPRASGPNCCLVCRTCMKKTSAPDKRSNQPLVSFAAACIRSADEAVSDSTQRATHCIVKCTSLLCARAHDSYIDMVYVILCVCLYIGTLCVPTRDDRTHAQRRWNEKLCATCVLPADFGAKVVLSKKSQSGTMTWPNHDPIRVNEFKI